MRPMQRPSLPGFRSEEEEAARLGIGLTTLRRWRRMRTDPPHVKVGRRILYDEDPETEIRWLATQKVEAERKNRRRGRPRRTA
jgi:hypothetical protein